LLFSRIVVDFVPGFTRSLVAAPIQAPSEAQAQMVAPMRIALRSPYGAITTSAAR